MEAVSLGPDPTFVACQYAALRFLEAAALKPRSKSAVHAVVVGNRRLSARRYAEVRIRSDVACWRIADPRYRALIRSNSRRSA